MPQQCKGNRCESISVTSCAAGRKTSECSRGRLDLLAVLGGEKRKAVVRARSAVCRVC